MPTILIARNHEQLVPEELFSAYRRRRIAFRHDQFIRVDMSTVSDGWAPIGLSKNPPLPVANQPGAADQHVR